MRAAVTPVGSAAAGVGKPAAHGKLSRRKRFNSSKRGSLASSLVASAIFVAAAAGPGEITDGHSGALSKAFGASLSSRKR